MIDPHYIRENPDLVKTALENRQFPLKTFNAFLSADEDWRNQLQEVDALKQQRNELTPKGKPSPEQLSELKKLSETIKEKQETLQECEKTVRDLSLNLPNIPHESTPIGQSEEDNKEIRKWGTVPNFDFSPTSHDKLGVNLDILDFEKAASLSGSRFVVYKGLGAKLERALINFMLDFHTEKHGYTEMMPPVLVNSKSMTGTGQLPKFADDSFSLNDTDLWLSPTAEVQLTNLYQDSIIPEEKLPLNITAFTPCFRKESGSYGKDTAGLIRLHQFNKVELVKFVKPEESLNELETLTSHAEAILQALKLPYRVVSLCTGDLGFSSTKTYDLEVWFPSQNTYREISSCSYFSDFQSRRAMIRYKGKDDGKNRYLHTINGSGLAVGRTFAAIIEHYQTASGEIQVPEVLQNYMGVDKLS